MGTSFWVRGTKTPGGTQLGFWGVCICLAWSAEVGSKELFFFCKRMRSTELKISALIFKGFMNLKFEPDLGCRAEHSLYFWQISLV